MKYLKWVGIAVLYVLIGWATALHEYQKDCSASKEIIVAPTCGIAWPLFGLFVWSDVYLWEEVTIDTALYVKMREGWVKSNPPCCQSYIETPKVGDAVVVTDAYIKTCTTLSEEKGATVTKHVRHIKSLDGDTAWLCDGTGINIHWLRKASR